MSVQARTDYSNLAFIRSGSPYTKEAETIKQDAGRSTVLAQFTVMGKVRFSLATTGTLTGTGDGTCTAVAKLADGKALIIGDYNLECTSIVTHGGIFKLEDPHGNLIAQDLTMTAGAGLATIFNVGGITFTLTDGTTDFSAGDAFAITVTADGDYTPLDPDDLTGGGQFAGIYLGDALTAAKIVAGDIPDSPMLAGGACTIDTDQLVFENSLTLATVLPSGKTVLEEMEAVGIFAESTIDIDSYEN